MKYTRKKIKALKNGPRHIDKKRLYQECTKKIAYPTTSSANRMIRHQFKKYGIKLNYYQCSYCGKYHLTKKWVGEKFKY